MRWEYCYVNESLQRGEGGGLVRDWFIARPDGPESRNDIATNEVFAILGDEGWELVNVVGVQTQYSEDKLDMGGIPHPSAMHGSTNTSSTMFYFKRPKPDPA